MYWKNVHLDIDYDLLRNQFLSEFFVDGNINTKDSRITNVQTGFLFVAKELDWCNEAVETSLGIKVSTVRGFITLPNQQFPIHRDCKGGKTQLREWAFNIPVLNCDRGYNQWFLDEDNDFGNEVYSESGSAVIPENPLGPYVVTERQLLDCPKLIRTDVHHNVDNTDNPNMRVILSYRSEDNISWDDIISRAS